MATSSRAYRGLYQRRSGTIRLYDRELTFTFDSELATVKSIRLSQLRLRNVGLNSPVYLLEERLSPEEGFSTQDQELIQELARRGSQDARLLLGKARKSLGDKRLFWIALFGIPLLMIFLFPLIVVSLPTSWLAPLVSLEQEKRILSSISVLDLDADYKGPQALALQKLLAHLQISNPMIKNIKTQVGLSSLPIENALTLPGGDIVFTRQLLESATSVEEIVGVLGHEVGHVQCRHILKSSIGSLGIVSGTLFLQLIGAGSLVNVVNIGANLSSMSYSREHEEEADELAFQMLARAGVSPTGFLDFFKRLSQKEGFMEQATSLLRSHPLSDERREKYRKA